MERRSRKRGSVACAMCVFFLFGSFPTASRTEASQDATSVEQGYSSSPAAETDDEILPGSLQFQFVIGEWDIAFKAYDPETGEVIREHRARQRAEYLNDQGMIFDEWIAFSPTTGEQRAYGVTLRTYSDTTGTWQNVFLSAAQPGPAAPFASHWRENEMHGQGRFDRPDGGAVEFRLRFFDITDNSFGWEEKWSIDGGKTWHLAKAYRAKRRTH